MAAPLAAPRVLDLTDERGLLCGLILADLGADVVRIEPPGGSPARRLGPFAEDVRGPERSLSWWAWARNSRSLVLDLETEEGREVLGRLAEEADFLVESADPGERARQRLAYGDLVTRNPALVYVSITPFGQDGPKARAAATDLTLLAAGGPLWLTGDEDRPPVRLAVPQAFLHAGADAAVAALVAWHERQRSGCGQHVDVSAQSSVTMATQAGLLAAAVESFEYSRMAGGAKIGPLKVRMLFPAKDGHVSVAFLFGSAVGPFSRRLMEVVCERGFCDEATRDKDWIRYTELLLTGQEPFEEYERVKGVIERFTLAHGKRELLDLALDRGLLIAPVTSIDEVAGSAQLEARRYWRTLEQKEIGRAVRHPGPFVRFEKTPIEVGRPAPRVGEHSREILEELASGGRRRTPVPAHWAHDSALADVKVLDFTWVLAGPAATRMLADYGATVVRIESAKRFDTGRTLAPFRGGVPGPESSVFFHSTNAGKKMMALDLRSPAARDVVLDLVRWADVVTESFSPKGMKGLGLDWESLRKVKPDLIMLSSCLMGQSGPLSRFAGYGNLAAAISGFFDMCGWPDRPPAGPFSAYTDYLAPRFTAAAILAALDHRRRTGEGQYVDQSQAESALHFLAPAILDYTVNGRVETRAGNDDADMAPHGVYPAQGDDRWVAIAVRDEADWRGLCEVLERPDLAAEPRFATAAARLASRRELDAIVSEWTRSRGAESIETALQSRGVPAAVVAASADLLADPQLAHHHHFVTLEHSTHGTTTVESSRFRLSRTPAAVRGPAPTLGRDNEEILRSLLGYDDDRITALIVAGALE